MEAESGDRNALMMDSMRREKSVSCSSALRSGWRWLSEKSAKTLLTRRRYSLLCCRPLWLTLWMTVWSAAWHERLWMMCWDFKTVLWTWHTLLLLLTVWKSVFILHLMKKDNKTWVLQLKYEIQANWWRSSVWHWTGEKKGTTCIHIFVFNSHFVFNWDSWRNSELGMP